MKKILLNLIVLTIFISCGNDSKKIIENTSTEKITSAELKRFNSIQEMLVAANDFNIETGTLKIINDDPKNLHIQVSKYLIEGDIEKVIHETVKRDIVYVAFQTFAQTATEKMTITSIPIDFKDKTKYYDEYKKTVTVNKKSADQIMNTEFGSNDYSILFSKMGNITIPSKEFSKLKFDKLEKTFNKLK